MLRPELGWLARNWLLRRGDCDDATVVHDGSYWHVETVTRKPDDEGHLVTYTTNVRGWTLIGTVRWMANYLRDQAIYGDVAIYSMVHDFRAAGFNVKVIEEEGTGG